MITVWEYHPTKKEVTKVPLDKHKVGSSLAWIDCSQPTREELLELSKKTGIAGRDIHASIDPDKRPHVRSYDKYSFISFRVPYEDKAGKIHTMPASIFLFRSHVVTVHDKPLKAVDEFRKLSNDQWELIFKKGAPYFAYRFMDAAISDFFIKLDHMQDQIEKVENQVLHDPTKMVTQHIFVMKRTLIYLHKALAANRDVISAIEKHYISNLKESDLHLFRDLYNDTSQLIDMVSTYRDIITSILDMYLSSVSNSLNKVMKTLTAISAFVLIPTLITGIYGMNFQRIGSYNMPELYWPYGYVFALGLMVFSIAVIFIWFKVKKWL
jgi:magnesium transporter